MPVELVAPSSDCQLPSLRAVQEVRVLVDNYKLCLQGCGDSQDERAVRWDL
jgi:hypothetical protein